MINIETFEKLNNFLLTQSKTFSANLLSSETRMDTFDIKWFAEKGNRVA